MKRRSFWKWLVTEGKFWLFLWLFCFAGMIWLDMVYGYNGIGGIFETTIWYVGIGIPLLYGLYTCYLEENEKENKQTLG